MFRPISLRDRLQEGLHYKVFLQLQLIFKSDLRPKPSDSHLLLVGVNHHQIYVVALLPPVSPRMRHVHNVTAALDLQLTCIEPNIFQASRDLYEPNKSLVVIKINYELLVLVPRQEGLKLDSEITEVFGDYWVG